MKGSRFKFQWGQKFSYQRKKKKVLKMKDTVINGQKIGKIHYFCLLGLFIY